MMKKRNFLFLIRKLKGNPVVCDCELKVILEDSFLKSKLKDFDDIFCQNHANHTTKQVLQELVCGNLFFLKFLDLSLFCVNCLHFSLSVASFSIFLK